MLEFMLGSKAKTLAALDNSDMAFPAGTPFKGVVPSANFITGTALAAAVGFTDGSAQNDDCGWLHFIEDNGLELYIAKKTIRYNLSWEQLHSKGLSLGTTEITIDGVVYIVRLLTGGVPPNNTLAVGGEWNRYMYNVYTMADRSTFPPDALYWADYTGPMLGVATVDRSTEVGTASICADDFGNVAHITRGSSISKQTTDPQITGIWYVDPNSPAPTAGWRPVLELVP